ncbi:MAG: hypothetical protein J6W03_06155 [Bacteroidaceae bacterium]|nr:hypothetical protein [Bacteroidaceae bacterium]
MQYNKVLAIALFGTLLACNACKRETKDEKFKRDYEQFTQKECPRHIDQYTRMDSVLYDIESRTLTEYYTVSGRLDVDSIYTDGTLISDFRESLLKGLKGDLLMKPLKDEGVTFHYTYRSATTGKTRLELTYIKEEYGK